MNKFEKAILTLVLLCLATFAAHAQSESGLLLSAGAEKKIDKKMSVDIEATFRTRNDFKTIDRWSAGIGVDYKLSKWLKVDAIYNLLYDNNRENISYNHAADGSVTGYNNWRPSYWGVRHRLKASLNFDHKFWDDLKLSLRERWQYTYRPGKEVERWDFDNSKWETKMRNGRGKSVLRSRLQVEYDKKRSKFQPYASIELYNKMAIEKIRYTIGTDFKLSKQQSIGAYYRFQQAKNIDPDDYEPDIHYLGVDYKFKF